MMYRRLVTKLNDIGDLIPATENVHSFIKNPDVDHYLSVYQYNEDQKKRFYTVVDKLNKKTKEKYKGKNGAEAIFDVIGNELVFDFDSDNNLEQARQDTLTTIGRLKDKGIKQEAIQIYFSGKKGFGLVVKLDECINPEIHKNICRGIAGDLSTWDTKIYNASRVLRVPNTKHPSTGLYKIPLAKEDLENTIDDIKNWAQDTYEVVDFPAAKLTKELIKMGEVKPERPKIEYDTLEAGVCDIDWSTKPKGISHWKFALQLGYFPPGSRNHALMILAATYRGQGLLPEHTHRLLKGVVELQSRRFDQEKYSSDEIWLEIVNTVYGPGWQGGTYAEDNFPQEIVNYFEELGIPRTEEADTETLIESIDEGFSDFINYATRIDEFTMKFGIPSLDEKLKVRKGHLIYMLAPPGVGKTSFAITLLNNMSKEGTGCYFGSYDMYKNNVYQKLIQRHTGYDEEKLYDVFRHKDQKKIEEFREILKNEYENVSFCYKVGQSIADLKRSVAREEERQGKKIELVIVDYLELVLTDAKDPTAASAEAAQGLRELANEGRVVFGLLQPNKHSSTPDEPITSYNGAKGSSSIAQSATAMITGHRPGMSSEDNNADDDFFGINCVKNRNGNLFSLDFGWKGSTQTIYELDDTQKRTLAALRKAKKEDKEADDL